MVISTPQQAGIALRALEFGELPAQAVVRWADGAIIATERPPPWLIDLSLLDEARLDEMLRLLHQHAERMESREVDVCILAHLFFTGRLPTEQLFRRAFDACYLEYEAPRSAPVQKLGDILFHWDQAEFPDPNQGHWRLLTSEALVECQRACGDLTQFVSQLYAA